MDNVLGRIEWLGHDGFRITTENGQVIYIDPFKLNGSPGAADIILITHEHFDHCSPEDVALIQDKGTVIITEAKSAKKLKGQVEIMGPGDSREIDGTKIEAVPSYNIGKKFHPQGKRWLGFIITVDGVRIYHAGDTNYIPEMKGLDVDIALLPVSGTYVMTADEAVQAALDLEPKVAVPMHYGDIVGEMADAEKFAGALAGRVRVEILPKTN